MICVDSSVALKWLFIEAYSDVALGLLDRAMTDAEQLIAPPLLPIEVTNALRQRTRSQGMSLERAIDLLGEFSQLPIVVAAPPRLHERALRLAHQYNLRASYDAHYIALAELEGCEMWTDDQRLLRDLAGRVPNVRWVGDYAGG